MIVVTYFIIFKPPTLTTNRQPWRQLNYVAGDWSCLVLFFSRPY